LKNILLETFINYYFFWIGIMTLKDYSVKLRSFILECKRVLKVTKKPSMQEYKAIVKVTALGMLVIGLLGFIISMIAIMAGI
tara:strand:+ start:122 stop:367 length:246 start_codon:yes stop_codon:yes gene_type:complete